MKAAGLFLFPRRQPATATEWAVRLRSPEATEDDRADFEAWLAADPRNREAYGRSEGLWTLAANARAQHEMVSDLIAEASDERHVGTTSAAPASRGWRYALAAAVVAVAVGIGLHFARLGGDEALVTKAGEQRTVMLADGSSIQLNTDTQVSHRIDDRTRRVALTRGEAFFDVAKDPSRPFVVEAGTTEVRVLGTQFTVRQIGERVEVVVKEGRVEVVPKATAALPVKPTELTPGSRGEIEQERVKVAAVDVSRAMAWRSGEIEFRGEPLEDVIAELNRYSATPMVIEDEALKNLRVSGLFKVADQQSIRFMLSESLGVEFAAGDDRISLRGKK